MAPSAPPPTTLTGRIVALDEALAAAGLDHAFGGALALAFCTLDPRATQDIDLNVFVGTDRVAAVLDALPEGVRAPAAAQRQLTRDGQARLRWDGTPVDLFLSNHAFHDAAQGRVRRVPFAGIAEFPVLACEDLAVFKAFFARPKDAVDLAAMVDAGAPGSVSRMSDTAPIVGVIDRWHAHLRGELPGGLDELLHDDVVFYSPIVFTPQEGKAVTTLYLQAAGQALPGEGGGPIDGGAGGEGDEPAERPAGAFRYTKKVLSADTAVLEFETTVEGKYVNGVDIIRCDDDGKIVEFRVMIRPLQAVNTVHQQMARMLELLQQQGD